MSQGRTEAFPRVRRQMRRDNGKGNNGQIDMSVHVYQKEESVL
jgi:hypothetical protein